jgi:hypothetical protein
MASVHWAGPTIPGSPHGLAHQHHGMLQSPSLVYQGGLPSEFEYFMDPRHAIPTQGLVSGPSVGVNAGGFICFQCFQTRYGLGPCGNCGENCVHPHLGLPMYQQRQYHGSIGACSSCYVSTTGGAAAQVAPLLVSCAQPVVAQGCEASCAMLHDDGTWQNQVGDVQSSLQMDHTQVRHRVYDCWF